MIFDSIYTITQQRVSWLCLLLPCALLQQFREELSCRLRPHHTAPAAHPALQQAKGSTTAAAAVDSTAASDGSEPTQQQQQQQQYSLWDKLCALVAAFKPAYWQALAVAAAVYFTRFDAAFLGLRAKQVGGFTVVSSAAAVYFTRFDCVPRPESKAGWYPT
jgi:hypothetical protein